MPLEDACPHRKLPLSMGRIKGDAVECGCHGLTFDGSGRCVDAATQDRIPPNARVRSYPVRDCYGLLWIWMGEPAGALAQDVIDIPEHDNPSWHLTQGDRLHCACHYLWLVDNLLDPSHVAWVHRGSFAGASTDRTPLDLTVSASGVTSSRWLLNQPPLPFYAPLVKFNGPADRLQHYEACYPSVAINKSVYTPAGAGGPGSGDGPETYHMVLLQLGLPDEFIEHGDHAKLLSGLGLDAAGIEAAVRRRSYNFLTPVDDDRTLYFWLQQRNTDPQDEGITQRNASGAKAGFEEDRLILEAMHQGMKHKTTPTTGLLLDAAASRFRQGLARLIAVEAGTQVDSPSIE